MKNTNAPVILCNVSGSLSCPEFIPGALGPCDSEAISTLGRSTLGKNVLGQDGRMGPSWVIHPFLLI